MIICTKIALCLQVLMETCLIGDKYQLQYVNIILSTIAKASIINIKWNASNLKVNYAILTPKMKQNMSKHTFCISGDFFGQEY